MNRELWTRIKAVAADAWERPAAERAAYVAGRCGTDVALSREVLSLLDAMARAGEAFETPALATPGAGRTVAETIDAHCPTPIGDRLGPWRLVRELGHGGMGTVYLAERDDGEFAQRVAIKTVRGIADPELIRRFRDERRILAALEHPHIARLVDGGATPHGLPYVAMEYVDGRPIDEFCDAHRLGLRQRLVLFRQVCAAVHFAHQRLIVHRDIKASNILVTGDGAPKLLDFGIAKILDAERGSGTTVFRMITPESASPEQIRGGPVTTATDVYALGVLLYRLLTKQSPYRITSRSDTALIEAVCEQTPVAPSALDPAIDADLDHIVLKALRKEPERRYGGADQLSDDLERYLTGRAVLATPDHRLYRARKFVMRHRVAVGAAAAFALAVAGGVGTTLWQARIAQRERVRAERQFAAVRTLAGSVLGELHDSVSDLPGSTSARELLLRRATEYLDDLSREAGANQDLRREVAAGYRRLGQVQGQPGVSNLGNPDAARSSYLKAVALLEPLASDGHVGDRVKLAGVFATLAGMERDVEARRSYNRRAVALIEGLPPSEQRTVDALGAAVMVWHAVGREQVDAKDYAAAVVSFTREVAAAEAEAALVPDNPNGTRHLTLALQQLGTTFEMLRRPEEALASYRRALALDHDRVSRLAGGAEPRLDLSSSYGAIGAALLSQGDIEGAREHYRQAIELRRSVVADDPENDRALTVLVYGHQRMALVLADAGDLPGVIGAHEQGLDVLERRAAAHPERTRPWVDHARALFESAEECVSLLESRAMPAATRRRLAARVNDMLERLVALRTRWGQEHRAGVLPPADGALDDVRDRVRRLLAPGTRPSPPSR